MKPSHVRLHSKMPQEDVAINLRRSTLESLGYLPSTRCQHSEPTPADVYLVLSEEDRSQIASECFQAGRFDGRGDILCSHSGRDDCRTEYLCEVFAAALLIPRDPFLLDYQAALRLDRLSATKLMASRYDVEEQVVRFRYVLEGGDPYGTQARSVVEPPAPDGG